MQNKFKVTKNELMLSGMVFSLFLICFYLRYPINSIFANVNILFYVCYFSYIVLNKTIIRKKVFYIFLIITIHCIIINIIKSVSLVNILFEIILHYLPLVVLVLDVKLTQNQRQRYSLNTIRLINFFVITIFIIYLVDVAFNSIIMTSLANTVMPNLKSWLPPNGSLFTSRYASYMGHYLTTAEVYMIFFFLNLVYKSIFKKDIIRLWLLYLISAVGILSTGGKTAILLYLVSIIWINIKGKKKIRNCTILSIFIILLFFSGFFSVLLDRFSTSSLTTGRNEVWGPLFKMDVLDIKILTGYGRTFDGLIESILGTSSAGIIKEYPFLVMLYEYGIVHMLFMLVILIISPVKRAIKERKSIATLSLIVVFLLINAFNGYYVLSDSVLLYILFVFIIRLMIDCKEQ